MDRSRGRPVANLEWRIRLFGAGAILAVVGMATGQAWLVNLAIAVLLLGLVLRFASSRRERAGESDDS